MFVSDPLLSHTSRRVFNDKPISKTGFHTIHRRKWSS